MRSKKRKPARAGNGIANESPSALLPNFLLTPCALLPHPLSCSISPPGKVKETAAKQANKRTNKQTIPMRYLLIYWSASHRAKISRLLIPIRLLLRVSKICFSIFDKTQNWIPLIARLISFGFVEYCKTVVFFANASDGPYSNERSGASVKHCEGEWGETLMCEARALHARGLRLRRFAPSETTENDCFAVYPQFKIFLLNLLQVSFDTETRQHQ